MPDGVQVQGDLFHGRIPDGAVYVGRPAPGFKRSPWANPFKKGRPVGPTVQIDGRTLTHRRSLWSIPADDAQAVDWFRDLLVQHYELLVPRLRHDLRGRDLACWCKVGQPCHRDVLLAVANQLFCEDCQSREDLDGAMFSVWLHSNWQFQIKKMTTHQREAAVAAVLRYDRDLKSDSTCSTDELLTREHLVWWD